MPSERSKDKKARWLKKFEAANSVNAEDAVWSGGREDDIVVVVMGPSGAGKSTFVKHLVSDRVNNAVTATIKIMEDLKSGPVHVQPIPILASNVPIFLQGRDPRLVIVDTPCFGHTYADDSVILKRIADWLAFSYCKGMKLGGVIYLYDISLATMRSGKDFAMFQALCGDSAAKVMILCTTNWGLVLPDVAMKREKQLCEKFWGNAIELGARTERFENTSQSGWGIVKTLLDDRNLAVEAQVLRIQEELVELEKPISTTDAGKILNPTLQEVHEMENNSLGGLWHRFKSFNFRERYAS